MDVSIRRHLRFNLQPIRWLALLCALVGSPAYSQSGSTLVGRVVKENTPVPQVEVSLHQVTAQRSGMIARAPSAADGSFSFVLPPSDSAGFNVFFVTVEHQGVRYFGAPVHRGEVPAGYSVAVFDTTSSLPGAVRIARRGVILFPETDGSWSANELIRVVNTARKTLVPAGGAPVWEFPLPEGATEFEVTEGDAANPELQVMGQRALFVGSLTPGPREIFVRYRLPADQPAIELNTLGVTDTFDVFIPEGAAQVTVSGLPDTKVTAVENQRFVQYSGTNLPTNHLIRVAWGGSGPPVDPVVAGLVVAVAILAVGTWLGFRNRDPLQALPQRRGPSPDAVPPTGSGARS
ncbi:MAG: hypothetical protein KY464_00830 [Gemmatimonadetes bacterium]|nr:hypothetical protein [Gemmatimonadota bacterium]